MQLPVEAVDGQDIHLHTQQRPHLPVEAHKPHRDTSSVLDVHEEVEVALGPGLTSGTRPEHAKVLDAISGCQGA